MTGRPIRLTLPEPLAKRIDALRGEDEVQDFILAALRERVYGSLIEAQLRAEVERLHQTIRAFAPNQAPDILDNTAPPLFETRSEPHAQPNEAPRKLGW